MKATSELIVGGEPRVNLLPPEVLTARRSTALRRGLGIAVITAVVVVAGGVGAASWQAMQGQGQLVAAQSRTVDLLNEQVKYIEVRQVQDTVDAVIAARWMGSSTEIDWQGYLARVGTLLPADASVTAVGIDAASPLETYGQAVVPLQGVRVATLTLIVTSPGLPPVPDWLTALERLPGFVDATPSTVTLTETGGYAVTVVMHVNDEAFAHRFDDPGDSGGTEPISAESALTEGAQ